MAMICVDGCKECTGCMACQTYPDEPICDECCRVIKDELYEDDYHTTLCGECLLMLHRKGD